MIDHLDKQTISLDLEKPKRGRPATGKAMTAAEKQKAYRERLKKQNSQGADEIKKMQETIDALISENKQLKKKLERLDKSNVTKNTNTEDLKKEIKALEQTVEMQSGVIRKFKYQNDNVTKIKYVIRTRPKGKRSWEVNEKEILWDSMEEAIETVKILKKESEKRGSIFEYKIEPASDFIENFVREFK